MAELYDPDNFDDIDDDFKKLKVKPKKVSAYGLIASKYNQIKPALERGVPLESVFEVLAGKNLKIGYETFLQYWRQIEKEKMKEERKQRREAKKALESLDLKKSGSKANNTSKSKSLKLHAVDPAKVPLPPPLIDAEFVEG